jgi:hypothetical protein
LGGRREKEEFELFLVCEKCDKIPLHTKNVSNFRRFGNEYVSPIKAFTVIL